MVYINKGESTMRQEAYARRVFAAQGKSRKEIALDVGYSPSVASNAVSKIESKPGFQTAISKIAHESNEMALKVLSEMKSRPLEEFSNKDLNSTFSVITNAVEKFNPKIEQPMVGSGRLRQVILNRIENQTINNAPLVEEIEIEEEDDLDF
jgi:hypothetical protein